MAGKRELIAPRGDKRFVRRDSTGRFNEVEDVGRSLAQDQKRTAKTKSKPGYGDKGDRPSAGRSTKKASGRSTKKASGRSAKRK